MEAPTLWMKLSKFILWKENWRARGDGRTRFSWNHKVTILPVHLCDVCQAEKWMFKSMKFKMDFGVFFKWSDFVLRCTIHFGRIRDEIQGLLEHEKMDMVGGFVKNLFFVMREPRGPWP